MRTLISIPHLARMAGIFVVLTALPALGVVEDNVARDFGPLAGYVVMEADGEFIIDLDARHGIRPGDIFAVLGPGKEIVHPVSQKVLGRLETVKGVLKVTRIGSGYSFARVLDGAAVTKRGDSIRRYALLPAVFWDYSGNGNPFYRRLQQLLPQLKWTAYHLAQKQRPAQPKATAATANALTFIYTRDQLVVRDPKFDLLRQYPLDTATSQAQTAPRAPLAPPLVSPPPPKAVGDSNPAPVIAPEFKQVKTMAIIPQPALMADFIAVDGHLWLASTDGTTIDIFNVAQSLEPLAAGRPSTPARILALKWWVPASAASPHLAVTTWRDMAVDSLIFRVEAGRLLPVAEGISRILGTFDLDADGLPETLLGQDFDGETFFGERIKAMQLAGSDIRSKSSGINLPRNFPVLGSIIADLTGDGGLENAFIRNGNLFIYDGTRRLFKSVKKMGGSLSFLTYDVDPSFQAPKTTSAAIEISPVAVDLNGDGRKELLALASDRTPLGSLRVTPGLTKTWIRIFKYDGRRFAAGTLGEEFELPLQGITLNDRRLLLVATEPDDFLDEKAGNSYLLAYRLAP